MLVATSEVYRTTSTVLVGDDGACLLVDPGVTAQEVEGLVAAVAARGLRPLAVWSTHAHWDHRLDSPALSHLPRWGAVERGDDLRALTMQRDADDELARVLAHRPDDDPAPIGPGPSVLPRRPDGLLDWPGPAVRVLVHRAHASGHTALFLPGCGALVAGDMLSDDEVPLLDPAATDPVTDHRVALDAFAALGARLVVPGHGTVGHDVPARIAADRRYLDGLTDPAPAPDVRLRAPWLVAADAEQRALVARHR
ncbi:MBL fold metallo-hydrolase [Cellulomonas composti]|uniref:MBL fold metallo-hydrolase n=1 Tax=Cellulomonas composti TaxID=266130 RepID=A0A511J9K8_9CELL|nr:MBL fold metallo-hydrolase [Cellulomonas composti]